LRGLSEKQKVVADEKINRDVFALFSSPTEAVMATLTVRGGALVGKNEFMLEGNTDPTPADCISLIADYYEEKGIIPKEVYLDFEPEEEDRELLSDYLSMLSSRRVEVKIPARGDGKALCLMARANAEEMARQYRLEGQREDKSLRRLSVLLGLDKPPHRIEAYDISNIGDECIRASMVVYADGKAKKSEYRSFKISTDDGRDDYGSMRQVLTRRLSHIGDGSQSLGERPDLILLDGGDTHVGVGKAVLKDLGLDIPLFGMVKDDFHKTRAITDGEKEISIATEMGVYTFIYNIQEEAHRFAIKQSTGEKTKTLSRSTLEKIKGIGPAKAKRLLSEMRMSEIKEASAERLMLVKGISEADAKAIFKHYHSEN
jgi:excinuclease ABC subunit C